MCSDHHIWRKYYEAGSFLLQKFVHHPSWQSEEPANCQEEIAARVCLPRADPLRRTKHFLKA